MCERTSVLQPSRFHPCPSRRDSVKTNCEDPMFRNSVWHSYWQKYGFISVKKFETSTYVVGLSVPRKFELNFWATSWSLKGLIPSRAWPDGDIDSTRKDTVFSTGSTKTPAHPEDGNGVSPRNVWQPHLDAAVCLRKLHQVLRILNWSTSEK